MITSIFSKSKPINFLIVFFISLLAFFVAILRFDETLPEFRILSETGSGAILKAGFGKIPTGTGQVGIISAIDCIRSIPSSEGV